MIRVTTTARAVAASIRRTRTQLRDAIGEGLERWGAQTESALRDACPSTTAARFVAHEGDDGSMRVWCGHPLGEWLENGTGIYGPRRSFIVPVSRECLRWVSQGMVHYARRVRGMEPRPWFWGVIANELRRSADEVGSRVRAVLGRQPGR